MLPDNDKNRRGHEMAQVICEMDKAVDRDGHPGSREHKSGFLTGEVGGSPVELPSTGDKYAQRLNYRMTDELWMWGPRPHRPAGC